MRHYLVLIVALALGACTYHAKIPAIDGSSIPMPGDRQPGKFAALVQTGGWDMNTEITTFRCSAHKFDADLNGPWLDAIKGSLTKGLENVDFIPTFVPASELKTKQYAAEIGVMQSNATSQVQFVAGFFSGTATSTTKLDAILTITYPNGEQKQEPVEGQGIASGDVFGCGDAADAIGQSSAAAIIDLAQKSVITTKLILAQRKSK